jgi:hypothetical protein
VGWYGPAADGGVRQRHGGHWVTASGYFATNMIKGIYVKDDQDQDGKGGQRQEYHEWGTLENGQPYLEGMTDGKGNIAIIESVVSESYDPSVTFEDEPIEDHPYPWNEMTLTGEHMKPFYSPALFLDKKSALVPILAGVVSTGALVYVLLDKKEDDPTPCDATATAIAISPQCGMSNGSVIIEIDPPGIYSYAWSSGSTLQNIYELLPGTYTVTITQEGTTCNIVLETTLTNQNPDFSATITTQPASCGENNGSAMVMPQPGGIYSYQWSNGATTQNQSMLAAGNYEVTVSLGGTCQKVFQVVIDEDLFEGTITISSSPSDCGKNNGSLEAMVDPPGTYEFLWSNGQPGNQISNLAPGTYSITVTQAGSTCSATAEGSVEELPPGFTLNITSTPSNCGGNDGSATVTADPPDAYEYLWSDGQTTAEASGLSAGTYMVTVTISGSDCSMSTEVTVDDLPPSFTLTFTSTSADCGQSNGSATVSVDPPGTYDYAWPGGQSTSTVADLMTGTYQVTVSIPSTSCSQVIDVQVDQTPLEASITTSSTPAGCGIASGTATVDTVTSPPGFLISIEWSNGQMGPMATGLLPGQYTVTVTLQAPECFGSITDTVTVEQVKANFTGMVMTTPADCGISNGTATVTIDPPGSYMYDWSNQQTGPDLQMVMSGSYTVVVTDLNSCTAAFDAEIGEIPADLIDITGMFPATCIGGGEISFMLMTQGSGPFSVQVTGPEGTNTFQFTSGNHVLSPSLNIVPGTYSLVVFDTSIGPMCSDSQMVEVVDETPDLTSADDFYTTQSEQAISGNVLDNDSGLNIEMTEVNAIIGGTVTFNANGNFTYTPNAGFAGEGSFVYTVTDACGNTSTAVVTITVEMVECNFTISTTLVPAHCDLSDGVISVEVNEPGTYTYLWSNGASGPEIEDIPAGTYTVTIEEINTGCILEFEIDLPEYPADYIQNLIVTQPSCSESGEIQFTLTAPNPGDILNLSVEHPNGSEVFFVSPGDIALSDYVDITPGLYMIEVFIGNAGPDCVDAFSVTINPPPIISIGVEAVFPPSSPSGMDGMAIIAVIDPGEVPYLIFLNDAFYGADTDETIEVTGLAVGAYSLYITDNAGCVSNTVFFEVPLPDIIISVQSVLTNGPITASTPEQTLRTDGPVFFHGMSVSLSYPMGKRWQQWRYQLGPDVNSSMRGGTLWQELEYRSEIISFSRKKWQFTMAGGAGLRPMKELPAGYSKVYLEWHTSSSIRLGKMISMEAGLTCRRGKQWEPLQASLMINVPLMKLSHDLRPFR